MKNYFYDENQIRYTLTSTHGIKPLNWLFIPGGPGADSSYFLSLTEQLQCSGNTWLIDFPGNGTHTIWKEGFDRWLDFIVPMVKKFQNPIIIGHSCGGQFALLFKELEGLLKGLVLLNSSPCLWLDEAVKFAKENNLPDLSDDMKEFTQNPTQETFKKALFACSPYYFSPAYFEKGLQFLDAIPFAFEPAVWWQHKAVEIDYNASWIPQHVKTLIISAEFDGIIPSGLFMNDKRFDRSNITKHVIKNAGHFPWIEEPEKVKLLFKEFESSF